MFLVSGPSLDRGFALRCMCCLSAASACLFTLIRYHLLTLLAVWYLQSAVVPGIAPFLFMLISSNSARGPFDGLYLSFHLSQGPSTVVRRGTTWDIRLGTIKGNKGANHANSRFNLSTRSQSHYHYCLILIRSRAQGRGACFPKLFAFFNTSVRGVATEGDFLEPQDHLFDIGHVRAMCEEPTWLTFDLLSPPVRPICFLT
ncbi:hypothetical protein VTN00DRAFT_6747 [Thermoascus crustaceus]|uniref:uncharacterized protein n=1 Tax=Thermoascus crustaceus TaxID=5088 RepID=UPI003742A1B1